MTDDTRMWETHSKMITPKLSSACHVVRAFKPFVSQDILKVTYHSSFRYEIWYYSIWELHTE